ncbi:MAG: winged helix-turn-helix domain-containing protein [Candidatus Eremiobacteraeota bacterium]|nr:winged helix-turn-helix domain-containing protein [Candidatus Eremiobacteraeota bacterium]
MEQPAVERSLIFALGPYLLDAQRLLLMHEGQPLALGPKVVETLLALVERAGEVMTKGALLDRIWPEGYVEEANLAQNIYVLRKILALHWNEKPIETIPRRGYRFVAQVRAADAIPVPALKAVQEPKAVKPRLHWAAFAIAAALLVGITSFTTRTTATTAHARALSAQGAQSYALGRYYWNLRTPRSLAKSIPYFEAVTRSDPNDAVGYAALADAYIITAERCREMHGCKPIVRAHAYARRALAIDPNSAEAHTAHAMILDQYDNRGLAAEAEFRKAIEIAPNYALAHQWYGTTLMTRGNLRQARKQLETAIALEPVATATNAWLGTEAYFDHRYAASVTYNRLALDLNPDREDALLLLGLSQEQLGDYGAALKSFTAFGSACKCRAESTLLIAAVYARMGHRSEAMAAVSDAIARARDLPMDEVAIAFIALGDRTRALSYMRRVRFKNHSERLFLALDPRLDPVRRDARFRLWTNAV